jgi:hypothetical protein
VSDGSQTFESASGGTGRKPAANQSSSDQSLEFYDALTGDETKSDSGLVAFNEQDDRNLQRFLESLKQSPAASDRTESLEADQPDTVDGDTVPSARQVTLPKWADLKPSLVTLDRDTMPSTKTTKAPGSSGGPTTAPRLLQAPSESYRVHKTEPKGWNTCPITRKRLPIGGTESCHLLWSPR